ncbi:MAG: hypothetical protein ACI8WT_004881 [Clostridium sp.]|jgi:hypothetical protein
MNSKWIFALFLIILIVDYSKAGVIEFEERDWLESGDITLDKSTGLEWIDLSMFKGYSIKEVEKIDIIWQSGFDWATTEQTQQLLSNITNSVGINNLGFTIVKKSTGYEIKEVLSMFGGYLDNNYSRGFSGFSRNHESSNDLYYNSYIKLRNLDTIRDRFWMEAPDASLKGSFGENYKYEYVGSFLVRNSTSVPEPSTLAIFTLGMIVLVSGRFKKKS